MEFATPVLAGEKLAGLPPNAAESGFLLVGSTPAPDRPAPTDDLARLARGGARWKPLPDLPECLMALAQGIANRFLLCLSD